MDVILTKEAYIGRHCSKGSKVTINDKQFDQNMMVKVGTDKDDDTRKSIIIELLESADHSNDAQWTQQGKISMKYVESILSDASREEVEAAYPGFTRK